ncbi:MAG: Fic family protein [Candidatus Beckwithbacteria bacterium]|nr:Fic family protein [Patescibacteria group bacterium]
MVKTNLNNRQKNILNFLDEDLGLLRAEIEDKLAKKEVVSRITVIRDLNKLVEFGYVILKGKGKATKYFLLQKNSLLRELNIDQYFKKEQGDREVRIYNEGIYKNLEGLYSKREIELWGKSLEHFKQAKSGLDPSIFKRELERFIIEFSWKSSQIEGNTYSLIETETLIKQKIPAKGHTKEEAIMILNHKKAFDLILVNRKKFKKIRKSDVIQLHNLLIKGLVTAGIRSQKVRITGTNYVPLLQKPDIEKALKKLISHVNKIGFVPEKSLILAAMIAYLQPFVDGNKRTSRMIANAVLMANDYLPLSYRNVDVNEYRSVMIVFYEINNLYGLKKIFVDQLKFAINSYFN